MLIDPKTSDNGSMRVRVLDDWPRSARCSSIGRSVMFFGLMSPTSPILWHQPVVRQLQLREYGDSLFTRARGTNENTSFVIGVLSTIRRVRTTGVRATGTVWASGHSSLQRRPCVCRRPDFQHRFCHLSVQQP